MPRPRKMDVTITDTLIALVEERPTIWDKRTKSHAKRQSVEKCWKEISEALNVDENSLRRKWKYLRDQFCVELGKTKNANSAKWRHFSALEFLTDTVTPRVYSRHGYSQSEEDDQSSSDSSARNSAKGKKKKKQEKKKKKKKTSIDSVPDYEKTFDDTNFSNFERLSEDEDEHLHFFRSVLPHVRKIPGSKVLSFRGHIQSLVEEFAYGVHPSAASSAFVPATSSAFVPEVISIKVSPPRYSSEACDPIDTSE